VIPGKIALCGELRISPGRKGKYSRRREGDRGSQEKTKGGSFAAISQSGSPRDKSEIQMSQALAMAATMEVAVLLVQLATRTSGLTGVEDAERLARHGPNILAKDQRSGIARLIWRAVINPLVLLLSVLAGISFATGDVGAGVICR
jgi:magnesium-transporting ATPase (P-type)